jgi:hypothetical protein
MRQKLRLKRSIRNIIRFEFCAAVGSLTTACTRRAATVPLKNVESGRGRLGSGRLRVVGPIRSKSPERIRLQTSRERYAGGSVSKAYQSALAYDISRLVPRVRKHPKGEKHDINK